jgi:hypothetical protein
MITKTRLEELFSFDGLKGEFYWKNTKRSGRPNKSRCSLAGSDVLGYREIQIDGKRYRAHKLVWLWHTGVMPSMYLDHINGNPKDNRFGNLRECTPAQNTWNTGLRKTNKTGFKGVCWSKKEQKYVVYIRAGGKKQRIGCYSDLEEAASASRDAIARYHGDFARIN